MLVRTTRDSVGPGAASLTGGQTVCGSRHFGSGDKFRGQRTQPGPMQEVESVLELLSLCLASSCGTR